MSNLVPCLSIREQLEQALSTMKSRRPGKEGHVPIPYDCNDMERLTSATCPSPLLLINGQNYLSIIDQHAYYFAVRKRRKTTIICIGETPLFHTFGLISLASGIPQSDLVCSGVSPVFFPALNHAMEELYTADHTFYNPSTPDLDNIVCLAKNLKRKESAEVIITDALHFIEIEPGKQTSQSGRRLVSSVLQSVAHAAKMVLVAGYNMSDDLFADLVADSVLHCEGLSNGIEGLSSKKKSLRLVLSLVGSGIKTLSRSLRRTTSIHS
jgi:hypothetical protein